jgi:hypothetical protein
VSELKKYIVIILSVCSIICGGSQINFHSVVFHGHNIRMVLHEVGCGCEDWIGLAQDRDRWRALVSAVRNLRVP